MTRLGHQTYDFAVVGGGIAGLAIAELLQRSGASTVLFEQNDALCGEASAEQHGWFHTGALYSALADPYFCRTIVGNLDDLMGYYAGFPNMNLRVDKHIFTLDQRGWFSNRTLFYAYTSLRGVGWKWKLPWALAMYRARRRMSWFESLDSSRTLSHQIGAPPAPLHSVVHNSPLDVRLDRVAFILKSRDRSMDSTLIAEDLLRSYLGAGGRIELGTEVFAVNKGILHGGQRATSKEIWCSARHTILATGKYATRFDSNVRVVTSPLLVVAPALTETNFVRMTPHQNETLNHLFHRRGSAAYSVIGNALHYDVAQLTESARSAIQDRMVSLARKVWPHLDQHKSELFFGSKTEVASPELRNYLYRIVDRGSYTLALPGKFSLCFSLAVNVCRHFGIEPVQLTRQKSVNIEGLIQLPRHFRIASRLLSGSLRGDLPRRQPHSRRAA